MLCSPKLEDITIVTEVILSDYCDGLLQTGFLHLGSYSRSPILRTTRLDPKPISKQYPTNKHLNQQHLIGKSPAITLDDGYLDISSQQKQCNGCVHEAMHIQFINFSTSATGCCDITYFVHFKINQDFNCINGILLLIDHILFEIYSCYMIILSVCMCVCVCVLEVYHEPGTKKVMGANHKANLPKISRNFPKWWWGSIG